MLNEDVDVDEDMLWSFLLDLGVEPVGVEMVESDDV